MEAGARREGKSAWEIAAFYTQAFQTDITHLNILAPDVWCKATDTISEQIDLIRILETKGYTYPTSDGVYFDTARFSDYAKLSHQQRDALQEGARVEINPEKRNPTDFALWKFSPTDVQRQMEWPSPWGVGFPGWHIECSAMSMKYLGDRLDIHCGGTDHIDVHHTNEIAQSEAATDKPFFNFWLHGEFLIIKGGKKMAKSEGNFLTLDRAFIDQGIDPLVYRYAVFQSHYRKPMEFSDTSIRAAKRGLDRLRHHIRELTASAGTDDGVVLADVREQFRTAVNDDLNMPRAMAVVQSVLKSEASDADKLRTVAEFDTAVLGLDLARPEPTIALPPEVVGLMDQRRAARENKNWALSDQLRDELAVLGYAVQDGSDGMKVTRK